MGVVEAYNRLGRVTVRSAKHQLHYHKNVHQREIFDVKMVQSASSQSVGRSPGGSGRSAAAPRGSGATVRQRKAAPTRKAAPGGGSGQGGGTMWRFYSEDSPGLKVGPVPVLVMSLLFIASVFMLHIWGKYTKN